MSKVVNFQKSITVNPSGIDTSQSNYSIGSNNSYAYTDTSSTTYSTITCNTGSRASSNVVYTFDVSDIPNNVNIISVECVAKARISSTQYINTATLQLYSGNTAKGTTTSFKSTSTTATYKLDTGTWTKEELSSIRINAIAIRGTSNTNRSAYIYFYGANLTITYSIEGIEYEITSTLATDTVDSIEPSGITYVRENREYELAIYANSIDEVTVYDNKEDVTNQLVQHENENIHDTINATAEDSYDTEFSSSNAQFYASSNSTGPTNAILARGYTAESPNPDTPTGTNVGNYVYVKDNSNNRSTGSIVFNFDFSSIPDNATILSVSVKVYGARESDTGTNAVCKFGIYSGNTLKGSEQNITVTSNAITTLSNPGTWTRSELEDAKLKFTVGYYGGRLGGITWSVEYEVNSDSPYYWTYTLNNVSTDHTIEVSDNSSVTRYLINTSIRTNGCSVNDASIKKKEGTDFTLIIYYSNINNLIITDNGTNINSLITGSSGEYYYALTNLSADHNIIINEKPWYEVTIESLYSSATVSASSYKVYEGSSFTATVNVSNISLVNIKDNGEDITSLFTLVSTGVYRASFTNTDDNHEIIVVEANSYSITSISNTSNAQISPSGINSATENSSIIFTITTDLSSDLLILKDNETDVTSSLVSVSGNYQYTLSNINEDHVVSLYEVFIPEEEEPDKTYHSISISSVNATTNPTNGTIRVEEGTDQTILIIPSETQLTLATDNGVDISGRITGANTYDITTQVSGASYGFELNSDDYYESTNNGINKSASVARINFHLNTRCLVTIEYINYAEANYDYGMFGKIDTAVATDGLTASSSSSSPSDSTSNYQLAMASNSSSKQTITYTIEKGEHFVDIKYGKDDATNSNNDSLQWKISNIEALESTDMTYTINNVTEDHSLVFIFGEVVYYIINSSGEGCKLYPIGDSVVLPNETYSVIIISDFDRYDIEVYDNGRDVTKNIEYFETERANYYVYSIKKVNAEHVVSVICTEKSNSIFIKINGNYTEAINVFIKVSGNWMVVDDYESLFNTNNIYIKRDS